MSFLISFIFQRISANPFSSDIEDPFSKKSCQKISCSEGVGEFFGRLFLAHPLDLKLAGILAGSLSRPENILRPRISQNTGMKRERRAGLDETRTYGYYRKGAASN